jgi:hypothetical protein
MKTYCSVGSIVFVGVKEIAFGIRTNKIYKPIIKSRRTTGDNIFFEYRSAYESSTTDRPFWNCVDSSICWQCAKNCRNTSKANTRTAIGAIKYNISR